MKIDVVKYGANSVVSLASVHSFIYFKKNYSNWFKNNQNIYIRYVGKNLVGKWRFLPNRSTDFYKCEFVTSKNLIEKLNKDFEDFTK